MSGDDIVERLRYEAWHNPSEGDTADAHYLAADALAEIVRLRAEVERLRDAANRTLNAFFCCEGLDNTHLMDAFSEWAVLMGHAAVPEAKAWMAKWEARRD